MNRLLTKLVLRSMLILIILSTSIISLIPVSIEQQDSVTVTSNADGTKSTKIGASDAISAPEGTNSIIIRNAQLTQEVQDLTNQIQTQSEHITHQEQTIQNQTLTISKQTELIENDSKQTFRLELAGIIATIIAGLIGYLLSRRDLKSTIIRVTRNTIDVINADSRLRGNSDNGQVAMNDQGNVIARHERSLHESVGNVTDHIGVNVRRWHDDPNGAEFVNGRRGFYVDEE